MARPTTYKQPATVKFLNGDIGCVVKRLKHAYKVIVNGEHVTVWGFDVVLDGTQLVEIKKEKKEFKSDAKIFPSEF